jgi:hypothetical protein
MRQVMKHQRTILLCTAMGLLVCVLNSGFGGLIESASAQTKEPIAAKTKEVGTAANKIAIIPPPTDVNELSMEVAALRTLYLLKAGPDDNGEHNNYAAIKEYMQGCTQQPPRKRKPADVSKNYEKLLIDLRAAFIAKDEDRIGELSDQLEELTQAELPDLDDAIEITPKSLEKGPHVMKGYFDANRISNYIAAYGKEFPNPWNLMTKTVRSDRKGQWPPSDVWKETRDFVIKEVGWVVGGVNADAQKKIGEKVAKVLDRAYGMSDEQLKKEFAKRGEGLRGEIGAITSLAGPTDVIKHVVERDFAELFSNPRLKSAIEAREDYMKKSR